MNKIKNLCCKIADLLFKQLFIKCTQNQLSEN